MEDDLDESVQARALVRVIRNAKTIMRRSSHSLSLCLPIPHTISTNNQLDVSIHLVSEALTG